jgi:hypothetical protein
LIFQAVFVDFSTVVKKDFWSYDPQIKKSSIKIYWEKYEVFCQKKAYACWFKFVEKIFTTHEKSTKIARKIKKSGNKSKEVLALRPSHEKM